MIEKAVSRQKTNYLPADATVLYHSDDPDLRPVRLSLPKPPNERLIDGYGLPPDKQVFHRIHIPERLLDLEKKATKTVTERARTNKSYTTSIYKVQEEFWSLLEAESEKYADDINWVRTQWWHIINGYWFYNNGKPTYITGWHYFYLNFWHISGVGYPDYRDRDRKEFLFFHYAFTTKETFAELDREGVAKKGKDGKYQMIEMPYRTCFGVGQNKNRRSGNTNKGLAIMYLMCITHKGTDGVGIMSMSGDSADSHMDRKVQPAWRKMPLFIKPLTSSSSAPKVIIHQAPATEIGVTGLENAITFASTSESSFYDGKKLWAILIDESGKCKNLDVRERTGVLRHCIAQGDGSIIHGFMYQPSTAEELTRGGQAFRSLLKDSFFYRRNPISGQTVSGMFRLFMPADESLDGYIDKFGMPIKGNVLSDKHKAEGFKFTATQYLSQKRDQLLVDSRVNPDSIINYHNHQKQFPLFYADSWVGVTGELGFDTIAIEQRLAELNREPKLLPTRGNFEWASAPFKSEVVFIPNSSGKWYVSLLLGKEHANQKIKSEVFDVFTSQFIDTYRPKTMDLFTVGADPFKFKTKAQSNLGDSKSADSKNKLSDGGIAVFQHRNTLVDPENKPMEEWETNRFVCTYRYREVSDDVFAEDVLKTCLYYSSPCFPEMNVELIHKKFHDWGFDGFLKYQVDINGKIKDRPGITSLEKSKQEGFNSLRNYIAKHIKRERHDDLLLELKNIDSLEAMTKFDLLAAAMVALIGAESAYSSIMDQEENFEVDLYSLWD